MYKNEEEAVNQDSENVVLRAFEVLRSWKVATIQLKEKTDETQYSLWISETLKLPAEVKLKDEAEINTAEEYEVKVVQLEKVGLLNFANMVRQISANFRPDGDKEKESYSSMEEVCYNPIESAASGYRRVVSDTGLESKVSGSIQQY